MANKTYFWEGPFRFFFYSSDCSEPIHTHVENGDGEIKVWLSTLEVRHKKGNMRETDINKVVSITERRYHEMVSIWEAQCSGEGGM